MSRTTQFDVHMTHEICIDRVPFDCALRAATSGVIPFGATVFLSGFARSKRLSRPSDSAVAPVHVTAMSPGRIISSEPLRTVN